MEKEPQMNKQDTLISRSGSSNNPEAMIFLDNLFKELESDAYLACVMKGAEDDSDIGGLKAIRILAQQDEKVVTVILSQEVNKRKLLKTLSDENKRIRLDLQGDPTELHKLALAVLKNLSQQTVAAMSISQNPQTGRDVVQVHFPKAFMNLDPGCPSSYKEYFGLSVALYFLKKVPFK